MTSRKLWGKGLDEPWETSVPQEMTFAQSHQHVVYSVENGESYTRRFSSPVVAMKTLAALRERGVDAWMK